MLEDHPNIQQWVIKLCRKVFPHAVINAAGTVAEAVKAIDSKPDLLMADLNLPDGRGDTVIAKFKANNKATHCVVLTSFDDDNHLFSALKAGADGYLLKDQDDDELTEMLKGILIGKPPLSPLIAMKLMQQFKVDDPQDKADLLLLTPRENETLTMIAKGFSVKESAKFMGISHHTVSGYIKEIYRKLHVNSRAEAAALATKMGLSV